jgi:hypothetical protein
MTREHRAPPYLRIAALNAYNVATFAAALVVSATTGEIAIAACAVALEIVWLLFAPDAKLLQRAWFDRVWAAHVAEETEARIAVRTTSLGFADQMRVQSLRGERARIENLAKENPTFGSTMLVRELDKLDDLVEEFVELGVAVAQRERHLATIDLHALRTAHDNYRAQLEVATASDPRREVAARNLRVLSQRLARNEELRRSLETARGQMDLIESSFRLLADEMVTMSNPSELGERLDELRIAVDAVRVATGDTNEWEIAEEEQRHEREVG